MEDIININDNTVQIIFEYEYENIKFKDALYFSESEYSSLSQEEIEAIKQQRFQSWIDIITGTSA